MLKSQSGELPRHVTTRAQITFCIRYYLVKMFAARVQSTRSLLAYPLCSAVSVTTLMLTLPSIEHYISHPIVTLTTTCILSHRQSSPKILSYEEPLGGGSIDIPIFDPVGGPTSWFAPRQLDLWTRTFGVNWGGGWVSPRNSYLLHDTFGGGSTALNHYLCG